MDEARSGANNGSMQEGTRRLNKVSKVLGGMQTTIELEVLNKRVSNLRLDPKSRIRSTLLLIRIEDELPKIGFNL